MTVKTIIISNIAEAFEFAINKVDSSAQKKSRIIIEHALCDRTLLWDGDNKVVVTPFRISEEIFLKNKEIMSFKNVHNLYPERIDVSLVDAIMQDEKLLLNLCEIIKNNPEIKLSPYCVTKKFIALSKYLEDQGLKFITEEMPDASSIWTIDYLDSKVGSRTEILKMKELYQNVPESVICKTEAEATEVVQWFFANNRSCAIKANYGESGWGTVFIKKEDFRNNDDISKFIKREFKSDCIWRNELILVEEFIEQGKNSSCISPSVELFLSKDGYAITYVCDQVMGDGGEFMGVALGNGVINNEILKKLNKISLIIGKRFWEMGYRGYFDIDFILSENNVPYVIETNMRRTGGTHVFDVVKNIFGKKWEKESFAISRDNFKYGNNGLSEKHIMDKIDKVLYPIEGDKKGVIVSIINKWNPSFGFIVLGKSKMEALQIHNEMLDMISN